MTTSMLSLVEEHRERALRARQRAAVDRALGDERSARRHELLAAAYDRSTRMLEREFPGGAVQSPLD